MALRKTTLVMVLLPLSSIILLAKAKVKAPGYSVDVVWQKLYGGKDEDRGDAVVSIGNGEAIIVGTCKSYEANNGDICVMRMKKDGNMKWRILIGGNKKDRGNAVARAADGSVFVLGTSKSFSKEYDYDLYLSKVTLDGKVVWSQSIGGSRDEYGAGVVGTKDGGAIVVGASESFQNGYKDIYLAKVNANGKVVKQKVFGKERDDIALDIKRVVGGRFIVVGSVEQERSGDSDFFAMMIDSNLRRIWFKSFGGDREDRIDAVAATPDGGFAFVGTTRSYGSSQTDLVVGKMDARGKLSWMKFYGYEYYEYGNGVTLMPDGNIMVAAGTNTIGKGSHDAYFLTLTQQGTLMWSKVFGGKEDDEIKALTRLSDGSILAVGSTQSFSREKKIYLIKLKKRPKRRSK